MNLMEWFLWKPERAFVVSCVFFLGYSAMRLLKRRFSTVRSWPLLVPAFAWMLFALWEWFCAIKKYNIRVDLFFIYPILIVASVYGLSVSIGSLTSGFLRK
jgi:hypothetical protein